MTSSPFFGLLKKAAGFLFSYLGTPSFPHSRNRLFLLVWLQHYRGCQYMSCSQCDLCHCTRVVIDFLVVFKLSLFLSHQKDLSIHCEKCFCQSVNIVDEFTIFFNKSKIVTKKGKYDIPFFDSLHTSTSSALWQ